MIPNERRLNPIPRAVKWLHKKSKSVVNTPKASSFNRQHDYVNTDTRVGFPPGLCPFLYICRHIHTRYISSLSTCLQSHLSYPWFHSLPSISRTDLRHQLLLKESSFDTGTVASIPCVVHTSRNMSSQSSFKSQALKHCMIAIVTVHNPLWGLFLFFLDGYIFEGYLIYRSFLMNIDICLPYHTTTNF